MSNSRDGRPDGRGTAVLIDGDWLIAASRRLDCPIDFHQLPASLSEAFGLISHLYFFASLDARDLRHRTFVLALECFGFHILTVPITRIAGRTLSKGLDVLIGVKGADLLPQVDQLVLISGDADLVPLLDRAREAGKPAVLLSLPFAASQTLVRAATKFISLEHFLSGTSLVITNAPALPRQAGTAPTTLPDELYVAKGEYVEPYLLIRRLFSDAKRALIVIDPYVNEQIFEMIALIPATAEVLIITDEDKVKPADYKILVRKHRREGRKIRIFHSKDVHDRFVKRDDEWWHSGATLKDLGSKDSIIRKLSSQATQKAEKRLAEYLAGAKDLCP